MKIKTLRIHTDGNDCKYELFDRQGKFRKVINYPICIKDLPPVKYFGFCPLDSIDVTLEFVEPIDSSQIKRRKI